MSDIGHIDLDGGPVANNNEFSFFIDSKLFPNLTIKNIREIIKRSELVSVSAGQTIISEGEMNESYFIIKSGCCDVLARNVDDGGERLVKTLEQGDAFGEEVLLTGNTSSFIMRMKTDGVLMELSKKDFDDLIKISMPHNNGKHLANSLFEQGLLEIRNSMDEVLKKNQIIIDQRNQLEEKCERLKSMLKKAVDTQRMFSNERQNIKRHLIDQRQAIRDDLKCMINDINAFIKMKNVASFGKDISNEKLTKDLLSLGQIVVNKAKKINSITQWITSSTKVLARYTPTPIGSKEYKKDQNQQQNVLVNKPNVVTLISKVADKKGQSDVGMIPAEKLKQIQSLVNSEANMQHSQVASAGGGHVSSGNIADMNIPDVLEAVKDSQNVSDQEDLMKRYENTMWKNQDIARLKLEMDETHLDMLMTDIENFAQKPVKEQDKDKEKIQIGPA